MLSWLTGLVPDLKLAAVGMLVIAGVVAFYEIRLSGVRADLAEALKKDESEIERRAIVQQQLAETIRDRDNMAERVNEQNHAIEALQRTGRQIESDASLRAVRALQEGEARRRAILNSQGAIGSQGMNKWMQTVFSQ